MNDLLTVDDDNLGGLQLLKFAPRHFFTSLDPQTLEFKPGLDWIRIEVIPETGIIDHAGVQDDAGDHFNITVSAQLPKERPDIDAVLSRYHGQACLVQVKDQNGYNRLTGHDLGELNLNHSSSSGEATADLNGYRVTFQGKQLDKALFL